MKPFCEEPSFSKLDQPDRKVTHQINCHRSHDSEAQSRVSANAPVESWLAWPVDEQCVLCIYVYLQYNIYLDTYIYICLYMCVYIYIYIFVCYGHTLGCFSSQYTRKQRQEEPLVWSNLGFPSSQIPMIRRMSALQIEVPGSCVEPKPRRDSILHHTDTSRC